MRRRVCRRSRRSLLGGCSTPPAYQVSEPSARVGTVESITQDAVQNVNSAGGAIGGALIGGGLGSLIGGGTGKTVATVVGAIGGGVRRQRGRSNAARRWSGEIAVRYDDGSSPRSSRRRRRACASAIACASRNNGIELLR